jgi:two-component system, NtrC family, response regulator AtoC
MSRTRVLFVDDQPRARQLFLRALDADRFDGRAAEGVVAAMAVLDHWRPEVIVTDLRMPEVDGLEGLARFRARVPDVPVVVVTAFGSVETAVEAMRRGAFDYLNKPFDPGHIEVVLDRALAHCKLVNENARLRGQVDAGPQVIGVSAPMLEAVAMVDRFAPSDYPVLIGGESGTGKDVFARLIHARSRRAHRPFVTLNCSAIPEQLLESELFGHEKGAFSGAVTARTGFFAHAHEGTLFLDEIGDLSPALQPKLLRVLQDGEFYPVGARQPKRADVRLLCASNQDIPEQVAQGAFRSDLFYRLNTLSIILPPLRERPEDIAPLARFFLGQLHRRALPFPPPQDIDADAMTLLQAHHWPGNARELAHVIERAALMAEGDLLLRAHLPPPLRGDGGPEPTGFQAARDAFERQYFRALLERHGGSVQRAAGAAGLHRTTLYEKLARHGLKG